MKKIIILILSIALFSVSVSALTDISSCQSLTIDGETYRLIQDVTATSGTCFEIIGENIELDMNGHTAYFNDRGFRFEADAFGSVIHNGRFVQLDTAPTHAEDYSTNSIGCDRCEIHDLYIYTWSPRSLSLAVTGSSWHPIPNYINIYNLDIVNNDTYETSYDDHSDLGGGIFLMNINRWTDDRGIINIYDNSYTGRAPFVDISHYGDARVYNNMVYPNHYKRNAYAIGFYAYSAGDDHGDTAEIFNNTIISDDGRGIGITTGHNIKIYDNFIDVGMVYNPYVDGPYPHTVGFRIRYGIENVEFTNNHVIVRSTEGSSYGISITPGDNWENVIIANNIIEAYQYDKEYSAIALSVSGDTTVPVSQGLLYENNTLISNSYPYKLSENSGGVYGFTSINDRIIKSSDPAPMGSGCTGTIADSICYYTLHFGYHGHPTTDIHLVNPTFEGGASIDDVRWHSPTDKEVYFEWFMNVHVKDDSNSPLADVDITIEDRNGNVVATGTTDANGDITQQTLAQHYYVGDGEDPTRYDASPYTVTADYYGTVQSQNVVLDQSKTVEFTFDFTGIIIDNVLCNGESCNNIAYGDTITTFDAHCTDDGSIVGGSFILQKGEDGSTIYSGTGLLAGSILSANVNILIEDSGTFELIPTCNDDEGNSASGVTQFTIPWGTLTTQHVAPANNQQVFVNTPFTYTTEVTCTGGECGDITATLDPLLPMTASASSYLETYNFVASRAVDGNTNTYWQAADTGAQWLMVELGDSYKITDITIDWENAFAITYTLEVSTDGVAWTTIHTDNAGNGGTDIITIAPITARYVRMSGSASNLQSWGMAIREFEVYGEEMGFKGVVPENSGDPFYVTDSNPKTCSNMHSGDSCTSSWNVVPTGLASDYVFFTLYESDYAGVALTQSASTTLVLQAAALPSPCTLPLDYPPCDCISNSELIHSITAWYQGSIDALSLLTYLDGWKVCS